MSLKKKVIASCALLSIGLTSFLPAVNADVQTDAIQQIEAWRGNVEDVGFNYIFDGGDLHQTVARPKWDSTSAYEKTIQHAQNYRVSGWIAGANSYVGPQSNQSGGHYYDLAYNRSIYMVNLVREHGYSMAALNGSANPGQSNYVVGYWSPDSV